LPRIFPGESVDHSIAFDLQYVMKEKSMYLICVIMF
jgi:hypothetical protein